MTIVVSSIIFLGIGIYVGKRMHREWWEYDALDSDEESLVE